MRLFNFGDAGQERAGMIDAGGVMRDISAHVARIDAAAIAGGLTASLSHIDTATLPVVPEGARIGPCVLNPPTFYCIGLNYAAHADEAGMAYPSEPLVFTKAVSALAGPNDDLILPPDAAKGDWEVELGVVIGARGWQVDEDDALNIVAGYCVVNDLSSVRGSWRVLASGSKASPPPDLAPQAPIWSQRMRCQSRATSTCG